MDDLKTQMAVCQLATLEAVMRFGGMSAADAIRELNLNGEEFEALARQEELHWIADRISECLTP